MKRRRPSSTPVVLSLIAGISAALVGGSSPARAAVSTTPSATTMVSYWGTVDGLPESVFLSGPVQITTTVVRDPDFGKPPSVLLSIDLSNVSGVGVSTGTRYITSGTQNLIRPLVATDVVEMTFPFFPSGAGGAARARSALASFTIKYNVSTGSVVTVTVSPNVNLFGLPQ